MITLIESTKNWQNSNFSNILKRELTWLGAKNLPLQQSATPGSFINEEAEISVSVLSILNSDATNIKVKVGVMFSEILWAYCCGGDDPMLSDAYCELIVTINKTTAITRFETI